MTTNPICAELVFTEDGITAAEVWALLLAWILDKSIPVEAVKLYGMPMPAKDIAASLSKHNLHTFDIEHGTCELTYAIMAQCEISCLFLSGYSQAELVEIVEQFAAKESFIQARLFDREYDYWENASDPVEFSSRNRTLDGRQLRSNGLPFPLEKLVVDTSRNSGRRVLKKGFVESIGHIIWLGQKFWAHTKQVKAFPHWFHSIECHKNYDRIVIRPEPISELAPDTSLVNRVREALFENET
jgi:hypothetical protein